MGFNGRSINSARRLRKLTFRTLYQGENTKPPCCEKNKHKQNNLFELVVNNARPKLFAFLFLHPPRRGEEKGGSKDVTKYPFRLASSWLKPPPPPPPPPALVTAAAASCRTLKGGERRSFSCCSTTQYKRAPCKSSLLPPLQGGLLLCWGEGDRLHYSPDGTPSGRGTLFYAFRQGGGKGRRRRCCVHFAGRGGEAITFRNYRSRLKVSQLGSARDAISSCWENGRALWMTRERNLLRGKRSKRGGGEERASWWQQEAPSLPPM